MTTRNLLIVWHSRTGASEALARSALAGAAPVNGLSTRLCRCDEATAADLLAASGYLFVCPENLGSMSGLMKEFFDRLYYPVLGQIEGRPYAAVVSAGSDGQGAARQIERITTGWRLRRVSDPLIVNLRAQTPEAILAPKVVGQSEMQKANELGALLAQGIEMGVW